MDTNNIAEENLIDYNTDLDDTEENVPDIIQRPFYFTPRNRNPSALLRNERIAVPEERVPRFYQMNNNEVISNKHMLVESQMRRQRNLLEQNLLKPNLMNTLRSAFGYDNMHRKKRIVVWSKNMSKLIMTVSAYYSLKSGNPLAFVLGILSVPMLTTILVGIRQLRKQHDDFTFKKAEYLPGLLDMLSIVKRSFNLRYLDISDSYMRLIFSFWHHVYSIQSLHISELETV